MKVMVRHKNKKEYWLTTGILKTLILKMDLMAFKDTCFMVVVQISDRLSAINLLL